MAHWYVSPIIDVPGPMGLARHPEIELEPSVTATCNHYELPTEGRVIVAVESTDHAYLQATYDYIGEV